MTILTIGKRYIPVHQIAYVEPFDPTSNSDFRPEKEFKARIVLINRDTVPVSTQMALTRWFGA
jgi:hypothetical protein